MGLLLLDPSSLQKNPPRALFLVKTESFKNFEANRLVLGFIGRSVLFSSAFMLNNYEETGRKFWFWQEGKERKYHVHRKITAAL
jgi:hypothetical protein